MFHSNYLQSINAYSLTKFCNIVYICHFFYSSANFFVFMWAITLCFKGYLLIVIDLFILYLSILYIQLCYQRCVISIITVSCIWNCRIIKTKTILALKIRSRAIFTWWFLLRNIILIKNIHLLLYATTSTFPFRIRYDCYLFLNRYTKYNNGKNNKYNYKHPTINLWCKWSLFNLEL